MSDVFFLGQAPNRATIYFCKFLLRFKKNKSYSFGSVFTKKDFPEYLHVSVDSLHDNSLSLSSNSVLLSEGLLKGKIKNKHLLSYVSQDVGLRCYELKKDMLLYQKLRTSNKKAIILDPFIYESICDENDANKEFIIPAKAVIVFLSIMEIWIRLLRSIFVVRPSRARPCCDILSEYRDSGVKSRFYNEMDRSSLNVRLLHEVLPCVNTSSSHYIYGVSNYIKFIVTIFQIYYSIPMKILNTSLAGRVQKTISLTSLCNFKIFHGISYQNGIESYILNKYHKKYLFIDVSSSVIHNNPLIRFSCPNIRFTWSNSDLKEQLIPSDVGHVAGCSFSLELGSLAKPSKEKAILFFDNLVSDNYYYDFNFFDQYIDILIFTANKYPAQNFIFKLKDDSNYDHVMSIFSNYCNVEIVTSSEISTVFKNVKLSVCLGANSAGIIASSVGIPSIFFVPTWYSNSDLCKMGIVFKDSERLLSFVQNFMDNEMLPASNNVQKFDLCQAPKSYAKLINKLNILS
mgnify:CR=1 FL=1|jgi:hypothetical protein